MRSFRIVIQLDISYDLSRRFLERELPDIRQLTFERFPKAFYRPVIARCSGAGHALSEPVLLHELFRFLCRVLAASVAVIYRPFRSVRVSSDRHPESVLHDLLPPMPRDIPADQPPRRYIDHAAHIDALAAAFQFRDVRTPQVIRLRHRECGQLRFWPSDVLSTPVRTPAP